MIPLQCIAEFIELTTTADFKFGPDISVRKGCDTAKSKAKSEAIRKIYGEKVSSAQLLSCKEENSEKENSNCVYHSFLWNTLEGEIHSARLISKEVDSFDALTRCTVKLAIIVKKNKEENDPKFDFQVKLNESIFRTSDDLRIAINPSVKMYIAVFGWSPEVGNKVERLFPNEFDDENYLEDFTRIPTDQGLSKYKLKAQFPIDVDRTFADEHLIFVATKKNIKWFKSYDFDDFRKRLSEIRKPEKRVSRITYRIVNSEISVKENDAK